MIQTAGSYVQRMQKALVQMNVQLPLVVSDITGVTGLRIRRLRQRAENLGFALVDLTSGEVAEGTVS